VAKRHKPPSKKPPATDTQESVRGDQADLDLDPSLAEQGVLGNAALQARMVGADREPDTGVVEHSEVSAHALPLVEHALVALQLQPRPEAEVARFVEIVEGSRLSEERKEALVERLVDDQTAASQAVSAVESHLGPQDASARSRWAEVFASVADAMRAGEVAVGPTEGSVADRAAEWIGQLVSQRMPDVATPSGDTAADVASLCRSVVLWVHFEEDEEEDVALGDYALEESGA